MNFASHKKFLLLGLFVVMLLVIPLTVYFVQKQQETRSHAAAATQVLFSPTSSKTTDNGAKGPVPETAGSTFSLDVSINPGTNVVNFVKLTIKYDTAKLAISSINTTCNSAFCPTNALTILQGPTYTDGAIFVELITGADATKFIQTATKIGTITFLAKNVTDLSNPAEISFDTTNDNTIIGSYNCGQQQGVTGNPCPDQPGENVLSSAPSAYIQINQPTTPSGTPTPTPAPGTPNQPPVCASFTADRSTTGTAPLSIAFTATGTDSDGIINKVSFDFGDGPVQNATQGGGIGTNSVSLQIAHKYANPGEFTAKATFTDNSGAKSSSSCTQSISVSAGPNTTPTAGGPTAGPNTTPTAGGPTITQLTGTPIAILTPPTAPQTINVQPTPPGPGDTFIQVGAAGAVVSIIGGIIFLVL